MSIFAKDTIERVIRTIVQAYLAAWVMAGATFSDLFAVETFQYAVVTAALSAATALGLKNVGGKTTSSVLPD